MESSNPTHYVLVIHGTFAAPSDEPGAAPEWYQTGGSFVTMLNEGLDGTELEGSVWRAPEGAKEIFFSWSGDNLHSSRLKAGHALADLIWRVRANDANALIHLVAHSHGGNVVLRALASYFRRLWREAERFTGALDVELRKRPPREAITAALDVISRRATGTTGTVDALSQRMDDAAPGLPDFLERRWTPGVGYRRKSTDDWLLRLIDRLDFATSFVSSRVKNMLRRLAGMANVIRRTRAHDDLLAYLGHAWASAPPSHGLGRVVLLGTPFVRHLRPKQSRMARFASNLVARSVVASVYFVMMYVAARVLGFHANPVHWDEMVQLLCVVGLLPSFFTPFQLHDPSTNLYYDHELVPFRHVPSQGITLADRIVRFMTNAPGGPQSDDELRHLQAGPPLRTLVVNAAHADEALVSLTAEPLVYAGLMPALGNLITPRLSWNPPAPPETWNDDDLGAAILRRAVWALLHVVRFPFRLVWLSYLRIRRHLVEDFLAGKLLTIVQTTSIGLDVDTVGGGALRVTDALDMHTDFDTDHWDVAVHLSQADQVAAHPAPEPQRGATWLSDDAVLEERAKASGLWRAVEPQLPALYRRYGVEADGSELRRTLMRNSVSLEDKIGSLTGHVELTHSGYYSDPVIVAQVARFLATGRREG